MRSSLISVLLLSSLSACTSLDEWFGEQKKIANTKAELSAAYSSPEALEQAKALIQSDRTLCRDVETEYLKRIAQVPVLSQAELERGTSLYLLCPANQAFRAFRALVNHSQDYARKAAWQIAANKPSKRIGEDVSDILSKALAVNRIRPLLIPEVANAIRNNRIPAAYTFLRQGLSMSNRIEFAQAMTELNPVRASEDLMGYLAKSDSDELSKDDRPARNSVATSSMILDFFLRYPPAFRHPNFGHLFHYALAKNEQLASRAQAVLKQLAMNNPQDLARALAQLPPEIQISYLQTLVGTEEDGSGEFKGELRKATSSPEVMSVIGPSEIQKTN